MSARMPVIFIGHGSPMNAIDGGAISMLSVLFQP
jgi:aromatic ring-opening dioxygenase catalytic subunit (LigB family)